MAGSEFWASLTHRPTQLKFLLFLCVVCIVCLLVFDGKINYQWDEMLFSKDSIGNETTEVAANATARESNASENLLDMATKCSPMQYILFLKTHKAGSSTVTNIFFRYGDSRDLSFVLGDDTLIGWPTRFRLGQALAFDGTRPNFLCSHTRFNKKTMNHLFPKDTSRYITIVRNPVAQFESIFNYMGMGEVYGLGKDPTGSLKAFLKKGIEFKDITKTRSSRLVRNPMLFDLGMDYKFYQNAGAVKEYIASLEKEFDLVMISDYFDESVVLMKRLLCWEFDDILYVKSNERFDKERGEVSEDVKENIRRWNKADMLLFEHFNQTLWRKIEMEGEGFYNDLAMFRRKKAELKDLCFTNETSNQLMYGNKYAKMMTLKPNLPPETKVKCERMTRTENSYLAYLRTKRSSKLKGIFSAVPNEDDQEKVSWDVASDFKYDPV
ncbi:hypothetical protein OS493_034154 [Desmophyllum pertusum]|uniref:Galactosylceramide sulfotransferase-like n=1 Tax=Desmophyllum pertusum TaxID=174260 RepID=A0A9W9ZX00_9CNID|nr:hypothetical protein OS493_034154 [Desmophyllum pertusum]